MADAISETEDVRERSVPRDIGELIGVDEDEESDEDGRETSIKKLTEEHRMFNKIESFGHIHHASKDFSTMSEKLVNSLNNSPGAHRR